MILCFLEVILSRNETHYCLLFGGFTTYSIFLLGHAVKSCIISSRCSMARAGLFFNHWHTLILACACVAVWYITKLWTPKKVIQIIQSPPLPQAVVMQPPGQSRMNVQLMPTHIPDNPARNTCFTQLNPAKVVGTLINNTADPSLRLLPLYAQVCPKVRYKWYYFTRIGPGPDAVVVGLQLKGRDCMAEFGCEELSTGDLLTVAGLGDIYTVNLYRDSY